MFDMFTTDVIVEALDALAESITHALHTEPMTGKEYTNARYKLLTIKAARKEVAA